VEGQTVSTNTPPKPRALVDLDGTLAGYAERLREDELKLMSPEEPPRLAHDDEDKYPYVKERRRLIKSKPNWWFNLPRIERGFRIVRMMQELKFRISVLTRGPKPTPLAWSEKVMWCRVQPELVKAHTIVMDDEKAVVYGRVLMDDWVPYIIPWLKVRPRGLVILPDQPWNQGFSHPQVIRHTDNDEEVRQALIAQRDRLKVES
jgi:5'-nucleotidase